MGALPFLTALRFSLRHRNRRRQSSEPVGRSIQSMMSTTPADLMDSVVSIPSAPTVLVELEKLFADEESDTRDVAAEIEHDPAIAARVLRLANSPFYGLPGVLTSISAACNTLGRRVLRNTVLQASMLDAFSGDGLDDIWDHSFKVAIGTQSLISCSKLAAGISRDDAYTCGLMHDIGKLLLMQAVPEDYRKVVDIRQSKSVDSVTAEREVLGFTHVDAGLALASEWDLPSEIQAAIENHHGEGPIHTDNAAGRFVQFADEIAHALSAAPDPDALSAEDFKEQCRTFKVEPEAFAGLIEEIRGTEIPS